MTSYYKVSIFEENCNLTGVNFAKIAVSMSNYYADIL